jgi:hypothetical protein
MANNPESICKDFIVCPFIFIPLWGAAMVKRWIKDSNQITTKQII